MFLRKNALACSITALLLLFAFAGCGGGDGNSGSNSNANPTPNPQPNPQPTPNPTPSPNPGRSLIGDWIIDYIQLNNNTPLACPAVADGIPGSGLGALTCLSNEHWTVSVDTIQDAGVTYGYTFDGTILRIWDKRTPGLVLTGTVAFGTVGCTIRFAYQDGKTYTNYMRFVSRSERPPTGRSTQSGSISTLLKIQAEVAASSGK